MSGKGPVLMVIALLALIAAPLIYTASANGVFRKAPVPQLTLPTNATKCIEPTDYMRSSHMNLLKHVRDDIVRGGARMPNYHIENCKTCHTKRAEFCDRCHDYVGAKPECFDCHYLP